MLVADEAGWGCRCDLTDRGICTIDRHARPVAAICFYDFAAVCLQGKTHELIG